MRNYPCRGFCQTCNGLQQGQYGTDQSGGRLGFRETGNATVEMEADQEEEEKEKGMGVGAGAGVLGGGRVRNEAEERKRRRKLHATIEEAAKDFWGL